MSGEGTMTATSPATMILRFRDLVTSPGGTVADHNKIVDQHGKVWWGWWNKSGETVPDEAFRRLSEQATKTAGLRVLLLDSGNNLLFEATCRDIFWDRNHQRTQSPDPALTPLYYSSQKYFAWFQLGTISSIPDTELQTLTYVRVDEFFESGRSRYVPFYDKRVYDLDELRQQDRTIWFVRPYNAATDYAHKVSLFNARQIAPCDFETAFVGCRSRHLLWVSDLHFSTGSQHAFPLESTPARHNLGQAIEDAAGNAGVHDFAGVLVSGDLTWRADPREFDMARLFLARLGRSPSSLDTYRFAICPGNHDLAFSKEPENKAAAIDEEVAPEAARAGYSAFYRELFYLNPNEYLSSGRRFLLGGAVPVEVVCLNSSLIDQKKGWFQGHGFVGDDQLKHAEKQFGWSAGLDTAPRPFRILMIHHHLMPVTYREVPTGGMPYSVALDAEAIAQWVVHHRVDLVIHGHMHREFCATVSRPVGGAPGVGSKWHTFHVLGMGSSGAAKGQRIGPNVIGLLSFGSEGVGVSLVTVDPVEQSSVVWKFQIPRRGP
jgi:hypothetical protein